MATIFCNQCQAYFPSGVTCPTCGATRSVLVTPAPPGTALWRAGAPGSVAVRMAHAACEGRSLLVLSWYGDPGSANGTPTGGLAAIAMETGETVWTCSLPAPVEGGVVVGDGMVYAGLGVRSINGGQGEVIAVDLATGSPRWRRAVGGTVRSAPALGESGLYVTAGDGKLYALDTRSGALIFAEPVAARAVQMPADPVVVQSRGTFAVLAAGYNARFGREPGQIASFDRQGRCLWRREIDGSVRGTPAVAGNVVYVAAFGERPSRGTLLALDLRTGEPVWPAPFTVAATPGTQETAAFSAGPLVHQGTVYVGSLNHRLYAVNAKDGSMRWVHEVERGIAGTPVWAEGLVLVGANDGKVHAVDATTGARVWDYALGNSVITTPLVHEGVAFVGSNTGAVAALPWHLGQYAWAAERLEGAGRHRHAGDCRALAGHFAPRLETAEQAYRQAVENWELAGAPELVGALWARLGRRGEAAAALQRAGERWRLIDPERAARYFARASLQYYWLRQAEALNACTDAASICAGLPLIDVYALNRTLVQWEEGQLMLELRNRGKAPLTQGVVISLSGDLSVPVQFAMQHELGVGQAWRIPLTTTLCTEQSQLEVELCYPAEGQGMLYGLFPLQLQAASRPRPPVQIGDVGVLRLTLPGTTEDGIEIHTGDVGAILQRAYER